MKFIDPKISDDFTDSLRDVCKKHKLSGSTAVNLLLGSAVKMMRASGAKEETILGETDRYVRTYLGVLRSLEQNKA